MVNSTCGTLRLDNKTLNWVGGCLTTKVVNPTNTVKSPCGGITLDADDFRIQNGVVTLLSDTVKTKPLSLTVCGGLYFDIKHFSVSNGKLTIVKPVAPPKPPEPEVTPEFRYTYDASLASDKKVTTTGSAESTEYVLVATKAYTKSELIGGKLTVKPSGQDAVVTTLTADNITEDTGLITLSSGSIINAPTTELATGKFSGTNVVAGTYIIYDNTAVESASLVIG